MRKIHCGKLKSLMRVDCTQKIYLINMLENSQEEDECLRSLQVKVQENQQEDRI